MPDVEHVSLGETIQGTFGDDIVAGTSGGDRIGGLDGDDTISGLGGNDTISGDEGDDLVQAGDGDDVVFGEEGHDFVSGSAGNDSLGGADGNDILLGASGDDWLVGSSGNDLLRGNEGNDRLGGGPGNDTLDGGQGADIFEFVFDDPTFFNPTSFVAGTLQQGTDRIVDFGTDDLLWLRGVNENLDTSAPFGVLDAADARVAVRAGASMYIDFNGMPVDGGGYASGWVIVGGVTSLKIGDDVVIT